MLTVLGRAWATPKKDHEARIRFEYCREPGCLEMRKSARHAYILWLASGSDYQFRLEMVRILHHDTGEDQNLLIPTSRASVV
jgi:hypothetical protein